MFHTRTRLVLATISLFALSALPIQASAQASNGPIAPNAQAQSIAPNSAFSELHHEAKVKVLETQMWMADLERSTERLQERVAPIGHSLKKSLKSKFTKGGALLKFGDRTFSVYGLILMMAFAFVLFLMGLSNPTSRLGGRH